MNLYVPCIFFHYQNEHFVYYSLISARQVGRCSIAINSRFSFHLLLRFFEALPSLPERNGGKIKFISDGLSQCFVNDLWFIASNFLSRSLCGKACAIYFPVFLFPRQGYFCITTRKGIKKERR